MFNLYQKILRGLYIVCKTLGFKVAYKVSEEKFKFFGNYFPYEGVYNLILKEVDIKYTDEEAINLLKEAWKSEGIPYPLHNFRVESIKNNTKERRVVARYIVPGDSDYGKCPDKEIPCCKICYL